jgi:hypothetical protein
LTQNRRRAAERAAAWVKEQREKLNSLIAERFEQRDLADESGAFDLAEIIDREIVILRGFYDSLRHPRGALEVLASRASIEQVTGEVQTDEPPSPLPALTPEYRAKLNDNPLDFEVFVR